MTDQKIERKAQQTIPLSPAILAATMSALAGVANAGHQINIDSSSVDLSLTKEIKKSISKESAKNFDASVFENKIFLDRKEVEIDPALLAAATGIYDYVDGDSSCRDPDICNNIIDCYDACHTNCHGSRSWR